MNIQYLELLFTLYLTAIHSATSAFTQGSSSISPTTAFKPSSSTAINMADSATTTDPCPEVKVGDTIPSITLREKTGDKAEEVNIADLIAGKKVAIFGLPGAFTPGCSKSHLPSFMDAQKELKSKGVELTICIATNDVYVMEAWGNTSGGTKSGIRFLSDGDAGLSKSLGLLLDLPVMQRTKRFSLVADDGVVTHYFSSAEESSDTWAPKMLAAL